MVELEDETIESFEMGGSSFEGVVSLSQFSQKKRQAILSVGTTISSHAKKRRPSVYSKRAPLANKSSMDLAKEGILTTAQTFFEKNKKMRSFKLINRRSSVSVSHLHNSSISQKRSQDSLNHKRKDSSDFKNVISILSKRGSS